jgi:hypothetical protein
VENRIQYFFLGGGGSSSGETLLNISDVSLKDPLHRRACNHYL